MIKFDGMYSALFSLYDENMNVKRDSVKKLMDYNLDNGVNGFYVGGATGECNVLPNKTRIQMLETAMEYKRDGKIIAHIGATRFDDTVELLKHADSLGVDAVASLPPALMPYYSTEETVNYYKMLSSISSKPLMAYIQAFYEGDIVELTGRLMEIDNVIGIKLTVPDYFLFANIRSNFPDINILNGPDESLLAGLAMGANGAIGTTYNLLPNLASRLFDSFCANDINKARELQFKLNKAINILISGNMAVWKAPLEVLGIDTGYTVAPAILPTESEKEALIEKLRNAGITEEMLK